MDWSLALNFIGPIVTASIAGLVAWKMATRTAKRSEADIVSAERKAISTEWRDEALALRAQVFTMQREMIELLTKLGQLSGVVKK